MDRVAQDYKLLGPASALAVVREPQAGVDLTKHPLEIVLLIMISWKYVWVR